MTDDAPDPAQEAGAGTGAGSRLPAVVPKLREWSLDTPVDTPAALAYCEAIAFGRQLSEIEREAHLPPAAVFMVWVMRSPAIAQAFAQAREASAYMMEDEALRLLRELVADPGDKEKIRAVDLYTQQLWRSIGKRNPGVFSDKAAVNVTVPVQITTSLDMGGDKAGGGSGTKQFPNIYDLDASQVVEVPQAREPETAAVDPETGAGASVAQVSRLRRSKRKARTKLATAGGKRILIPKPRAAETAAERELRLAAEQQAAERRRERDAAQRSAKRRANRRQRERERERRLADTAGAGTGAGTGNTARDGEGE